MSAEASALVSDALLYASFDLIRQNRPDLLVAAETEELFSEPEIYIQANFTSFIETVACEGRDLGVSNGLSELESFVFGTFLASAMTDQMTTRFSGVLDSLEISAQDNEKRGVLETFPFCPDSMEPNIPPDVEQRVISEGISKQNIVAWLGAIHTFAESTGVLFMRDEFDLAALRGIIDAGVADISGFHTPSDLSKGQGLPA